MTDALQAYEISVFASLTVETLKTLSPYFPNFLGLADKKDDVFTQWMELRGKERIEKLIFANQQLKAQNKYLIERITELEKVSPTSGYTLTLKEYITTPLDEKVELLRNALLKGLYGDFSLLQREEFYKIVININQIDIKVLKYLIERYQSHLSKAGGQDSGHERLETHRNETAPHVIADALSITDDSVKRSLDKLRGQGLIFLPGTGQTVGDLALYIGCIPSEMAQSFLDFIADPQYSLKKGGD